MPKWTTLTNTELKDMLDKEGLNTQGTKAEMAARITKHFGSDEVTAAALFDVPTPPVTERKGLIIELRDQISVMCETMQQLVESISRLSTQANRSPERRSAEMNDVPETVLGATYDANTCNAEVNHQQTIDYLGHELRPEGICPGVLKTKAIDGFPTPKNVTDIRKFLGPSGYFRKSVPGYAIRSEPLRNLLRKDADFHWGTNETNAFEDLENALTKKPIMTSYRPDADHAIHTDTNSAGLAAVLMQRDDKEWKPIMYYSRSTSNTERNSHRFELEKVEPDPRRLRIWYRRRRTRLKWRIRIVARAQLETGTAEL